MRGEGTGRAHAKVILLGEHAVVYGVPAIATALPQLTVTTAVTRLSAGAPETDEITFTPAATMAPVAEETVTSLRNLVAQFKKVTGVDDHAALALRMDSMIPPGRGLGSSAACARSVVLALADLFEVNLNAETVFDLVQFAETAAHGKSSGVDAFATGSDGLIGYVSGVAHELICGFDGVFVVADSGASGRTKDAIEHVQRMFRADPALETAFMRQVRDLTDTGVASLTSDRPAVFGAQLSANHEVLRSIGLSTDHIDALVATACRAGALGAKISGGGLGGCLIALAADPVRAGAVADALRAAGAVDTWFIPVGRFADV